MKFLRSVLIVALLLLILSGLKSADDTTGVLQPQYERASLPDRDFVYYTVQPGDSLGLIARKFRVSTSRAILAANPKLDDDERLETGERIRIPLQ